MRCISVAEFGGPEVIRLSTKISKPKPSGKQVLVNVKAAGVNPVDVYIRAGQMLQPNLPYTPGIDGAGVIEEVGEEVSKFKKGDRIWFSNADGQFGSYSEYCLVLEENIGVLPETSTFEEGSMLGIPYLTAVRALFQKGKLEKGETVFIHGASGGVGTAAIQVCKAFGVRVVGTAGSAEGIALLRKLGIDAVYNHREPSYLEEIKKNEKQIDVILEMLGNVNLVKDIELLSKTNGRIVIIGSRGTIEINPMDIAAIECVVTGVLIFKATKEEKAELFDHVNEGLKQSWVKPIAWKVVGLEKAEEAHRQIMENKGARGQIVLKVEE